MNSSIDFGSKLGSQVLEHIKDLKSQYEFSQKKIKNQEQEPSSSFMDYLKDSVKETDLQIKTADKMATDVASGKSQNLHETMIAATISELNFNLLAQVRNKVLEAYQEIMRMPV